MANSIEESNRLMVYYSLWIFGWLILIVNGIGYFAGNSIFPFSSSTIGLGLLATGYMLGRRNTKK